MEISEKTKNELMARSFELKGKSGSSHRGSSSHDNNNNNKNNNVCWIVYRRTTGHHTHTCTRWAGPRVLSFLLNQREKSRGTKDVWKCRPIHPSIRTPIRTPVHTQKEALVIIHRHTNETTKKKKKRVCIPCCCCCFVSYLSQPGRNNLSTPPRRCERWPAITQSTSLSLFCPANIITGVFLVQLVGSLRCWPVSLYRQTLCHLAALLRDVMAGRINSSCDTALTGITRATSRHKCPKNEL